MLQWMREAQAWFIKGVLGAVVLAFVVTIFYQWGVRSGGGPTRSEVATIFGPAAALSRHFPYPVGYGCECTLQFP